MRFVGKHPRLGATGALAFRAADFLDLGALGGDEPSLRGFNLIEQQPAGDEAIQPLLTRFLAFDRHTVNEQILWSPKNRDFPYNSRMRILCLFK